MKKANEEKKVKYEKTIKERGQKKGEKKNKKSRKKI